MTRVPNRPVAAAAATTGAGAIAVWTCSDAEALGWILTIACLLLTALWALSSGAARPPST